jgi:hypothetical protein
MASIIGFFFIMGLTIGTLMLALLIWVGAHVADFAA